MKKAIVLWILLSWAWSAYGAENTVSAANLPDRFFITPEVWANPWENWGIRNGDIVNTHASPKQPMTLHHLTCQLGSREAAFRMEVTVRQENVFGTEEGSAGFLVGIRVDDPIDEYRSRLLSGDGLSMGITSDGELFIGKNNRAKIRINDESLSGKGVRLRLEATPENGEDYILKLTAEDVNHNEMLGWVNMNGVPSASLTGNVALLANAWKRIANRDMDARWAFSGWKLSGDRFEEQPDQAFGPVLWTQYTLSDRVMKLTAQMAPIGSDDSRAVTLQIQENGAWKEIARTDIIDLSWTAPFRITDWEDSRELPYRISWTQKYNDNESKDYYYQGVIRRNPEDKAAVSAGLFCCFMDDVFPNRCVAENVARQNPDLLFFTGDQIYEPAGGWGILRSGPLDRMCVNYLRKLALWGWSFRDLMKDRPTVTMPDDHDVYQGNIWGDAGRKITLKEWQSKSGYGKSQNVGSVGGYVQPIEFVKAVERTQTSHLPDPVCPDDFKQGLKPYFTAMHYGRIGFAILEDRKFKTGPQQIEHRHKGPRPDHISEPGMADDVNDPEAVLLGDAQLDFLRRFTADWKNQDMKLAVSQTVYCGVATHHGTYDNFLLGDMDSGGWPQAGRNRAVDALRRGGMMLMAGDQHLTTVVRHGIRKPGDGMLSFVAPAGCTGYQRWWRPEDMGMERIAGGRHDNRPDTGLYRDGFGNIIDVLAVGNPPASFRDAETREERAMMKASGWGFLSFNKKDGRVRVESWRLRPGLNVETNAKPDDQFPGWPQLSDIHENYGITARKLPRVRCKGNVSARPVVRVKDEAGSLVSAGRILNGSFSPAVYGPGAYTVEILSPEDDTTVVKTFEGVRPDATEPLEVTF
jgi:alkaline phosphatase D